MASGSAISSHFVRMSRAGLCSPRALWVKTGALPTKPAAAQDQARGSARPSAQKRPVEAVALGLRQ